MKFYIDNKMWYEDLLTRRRIRRCLKGCGRRGKYNLMKMFFVERVEKMLKEAKDENEIY